MDTLYQNLDSVFEHTFNITQTYASLKPTRLFLYMREERYKLPHMYTWRTYRFEQILKLVGGDFMRSLINVRLW